jgi:archaemetzincin
MGPVSYVYLQWIGNGEPEQRMLEEARDHAHMVFGFPARIIEAKERPTDAFDPVRGQYSSTKILHWVLRNAPADGRKIVAVTDADLFIPVLTFVFGEAQVGGKGAVVSTARLRVDFKGLPSPQRLFRARLLKECMHELGHTFGLTHCLFSRCVMSRSNTVLDVDTKDSNLCPRCRQLLGEFQKKQGEEP